MDSYYGPTSGCDFPSGVILREDNFGFYAKQNSAFRYASSPNSTAQCWLGSYRLRLSKVTMKGKADG